MNLESLTMEVRPRTAWESMDLAVRLAVTHWRVLFSSWMVTVFPLFVIISLVLLEDYPYWAFFVVWFLKPLYDRVPLFVLSRVIFSEKTDWKDVLNAIPSFFKTGVFSSLTIYRLDPGRAFGLPVRQLEGLKGKRRRMRMNTLRRGVNNREVLFFILCFHLEGLISWGLLGFIFMMMPMHLIAENAEALFTNAEEPGLLFNAISMLVYFFIMMIVETLYVAGGFVLYLNRRIILEGWDIELIFRKLKQRHVKEQKKNASLGTNADSGSMLSILAVSMFCCLMPVKDSQAGSLEEPAPYESILPPIAYPPLHAQESEKIIKEVMAEPVFNRTKTIETLKYIGPEGDSEEQDLEATQSWLTDLFETLGAGVAFIFEVCLWVLLLVALYFLIKYRDRLRLGFGRKQDDDVGDVPEMLFGLDLREESLPDDVAAQALKLFQEQDYRAALALLYRATLAYLVKHYDFTLDKGATEGDCLELVTKKLSLPSQSAVEYFVELTQAWQITAYAHRQIPTEQMEQLCRNWSQYYDDKNSVKPSSKGISDRVGGEMNE